MEKQSRSLKIAPPHLKFHLHKRFTSQSKFEGNLFFFIACSFISNRAPFYSAGSDTSTLEYKSVSFRTSVSFFFVVAFFTPCVARMHLFVFFVRACMHSNISVIARAYSALVCVYVCVFAVALCHPCCVLFDETSAERFSGHLVAVFLGETKERQLPKLALCQVGGEDMSGGITSPPFTLLTHTHTIGYELTCYQFIRWEALTQPLRFMQCDI